MLLLRVGLMLALVACTITSRDAFAQNENATGTESNATASVRLLSDLLAEKPDAEKGVTRKDVVLDLEIGQVALQVISWKHTDDAPETVATVPFMQDLDRESVTKLTRGLSDKAPRTLNRQLAATVYKEFGRDLYWSKHLGRLPADAHGNFDRERFELIGFAELKGKKVVDADNDPIGKVADIGIDETNGTIAYCVVQSEDKSLRAIPVGAFVERDSKKDWKIELELEQVMLFEPFTEGKPPQKIDRGWQEYVAVRYGRDALQTETKAKTNREKVKEDKAKRD